MTVPPFARPDGRPEPDPPPPPGPPAPYPPPYAATPPYPPRPPASYPPGPPASYPPGPPASYPPPYAATPGYPPGPPASYPPGPPASYPPPYPQPQAPRRGIGPAGIAAIVVLGVALLGAGGAWFAHERATTPLGEVTGPTTAWVGSLRPGHCVRALPDDGEVTRVEVVPCAEPHAAEVLAVRSGPGARFPGKAELTRTVADGCEMDRTQAELGLAPVVWTPGEDAWDSGHRLSVCLAGLSDGTVTGSFTAGDAVTAD